MITRRFGIDEKWAAPNPETAALEEASVRRFREWQYLAPRPDKPTEWEFALQILPTDEDVKALFDHYELNPKNPFHWRALLDAYAREFARESAKKYSWTEAQARRFAADLYVYFEQAGSWNARKAVAAMSKKKPWDRISNAQYMEKLIGDQNKIARFKHEGCLDRLLEHYGAELFLDDVTRSRSGKGLWDWDEEDWRSR